MKTKHINMVCGQNVEFVVIKPGGNNWNLNLWKLLPSMLRKEVPNWCRTVLFIYGSVCTNVLSQNLRIASYIFFYYREVLRETEHCKACGVTGCYAETMLPLYHMLSGIKNKLPVVGLIWIMNLESRGKSVWGTLK